MIKNMKIGKLLVLAFLMVTLISSIGGIVGVCIMNSIDSNYSSALTNYGFSQGDVGRFNAEFSSSRSTLKDFILYTDEQNMQKTSDKLDKENTNINQYLAAMQKTMVNEKEISYYNSIKDDFSKYIEVENKVIALAKQNKNTEAFTLLKSEGSPMADKVQANIDALIDLKSTTGNQLSTNLSSQTSVSNIAIIVVILISLFISLGIAIKISRDISKPVKEMAEAAQKMADGDLSVQISGGSENEIGQLSTAFSETISSLKAYISDIKKALAQMADGDLNIAMNVEFKGDFIELKDSIIGISYSLNDTLTQINQASEQVSVGSEQVSDGAQALAQGATEQASTIQQLSASITEISTQVKDNATHASQANTNAGNANSEIEVSNQHMNEMIVAMSQINDSSSKIGKIIKTIEDIAFQTNILALNAAVEAARAGAAGKGFAVVADEVRNLASKSAEAAKDTTALIENSMIQVESGTKIVGETAKSLNRVVESAMSVTVALEQISQATNQQADSIGQVTLGVEQISSVVQTNSATAEESAAASEELSGQAQSLKILVGKFKLRNQTNQYVNSKPKLTEERKQEPYSIGDKY